MNFSEGVWWSDKSITLILRKPTVRSRSTFRDDWLGLEPYYLLKLLDPQSCSCCVAAFTLNRFFNPMTSAVHTVFVLIVNYGEIHMLLLQTVTEINQNTTVN